MKRFWYVFSPRSAVRHRYYGSKMIEGEQTACGIRMQPGWGYYDYLKAKKIARANCKRCEKVD